MAIALPYGPKKSAKGCLRENFRFGDVRGIYVSQKTRTHLQSHFSFSSGKEKRQGKTRQRKRKSYWNSEIIRTPEEVIHLVQEGIKNVSSEEADWTWNSSLKRWRCKLFIAKKHLPFPKGCTLGWSYDGGKKTCQATHVCVVLERERRGTWRLAHASLLPRKPARCDNLLQNAKKGSTLDPFFFIFSHC